MIRSALCFVLALAVALGCAGCGKKLSPEALQLLQGGALAAKERAVSFQIVAKNLQARDAAYKIFVDSYAQFHAEGLAAQAKALSDLVEAASLGSFQAVTLEQLAQAADTAAARAEAWKLFSPYAVLDPSFVEIHGQALDQQAATLKALVERLPKKKE